MTTPDLDGLRTFVEVVAAGSFSRAATKLGVSKSIVSRRIAALEGDVGVRLLSRTTRGLSLTDAGVELHKRALQILAELDEALDAVAGRDNVIAGKLRIAAPVSFGIAHLSAALAEFGTLHPQLQLDIAYSDRFVDVVAEGFDAAVRIGELRDSRLVARRLAPMRGVVVASPLYLARRGTPKVPRDIAAHDVLIYTGSARGEVWRFHSGRQTKSVRVQGRFRADNGEAIREAAIGGLGIAFLPSWLVCTALAAGQLVPILADYEIPAGSLYIVRPPGAAPNKVRALSDFLAARFGPTPWDSDIAVPPPPATKRRS